MAVAVAIEGEETKLAGSAQGQTEGMVTGTGSLLAARPLGVDLG